MNKLKDDVEYAKLTKVGVIKEIREYLNSQLDLVRRTSISEDSYDKAAWPYLQAHSNGVQKTLIKILNYLPEK